MNGLSIKPDVCVLPNGRIGVFLGADYKYLDRMAARKLRDQLTEALQESHEPKQHPAPAGRTCT